MFPLSISRVEISVKSKKLLGPINLVINEKGITVVLGANGSGKTTLLEALHGLRKLSRGKKGGLLTHFIFKTNFLGPKLSFLNRNRLGNPSYYQGIYQVFYDGPS